MTTNPSTGDVASPGSTDDGLLDGIRSRDEQAWQRFVDEYSPLIYVWCRRCDLQSADARDVSQQALQAVSRSIDTFSKSQCGSSFRGWLFTITRNQIRNYLTRTLRGPRPQGGTEIQIRLMEEPDSIEEESLSAVSPGQPSPIQKILDSVRTGFDDRTWQCFWLVVMDGEPAVDVAEKLGMNPAAVRQAKYRVTKRLRLELEEFS